MKLLRLRRLLAKWREKIRPKSWLLFLPVVLLLAMAAAAAFLAWQGFTLLNRDDLATSETAAAISGAGSRPELGRDRVLGGSDRMVRVPREQADQTRRAGRVDGLVHRVGRPDSGMQHGHSERLSRNCIADLWSRITRNGSLLLT